MIIIILTGCIKIPIGDGNSLKISKDGLTVSDADGEESTISIDKDAESFSISSGDEEWEGAFGENIEIPKDFPTKDLPIPKGANVISVQKMNVEDGHGSILIYTYEGDIDDLSKMYVDNFQKNDFEEIEDGSVGEPGIEGYAAITAQKEGKSYYVQMFGSDEGQIQVTLMHGEEIE